MPHYWCASVCFGKGARPAGISKCKMSFAPGEARTHGLQIMRLTRCLLRYGGMYTAGDRTFAPRCITFSDKGREKNFVRRGIRTPTLIRGPEISTYPLQGDKALALSLAP